MVWTKKSGTILKRGHNVWQIRWEVRGPDGKRKRPARTIVGSYREADRELRRIRAATDNGLTPKNSKVTVAKYLDGGSKQMSSLTFGRERPSATAAT